MTKECGDFKGCGPRELLAEREILIAEHMVSIFNGALAQGMEPEDFSAEGTRPGFAVVSNVFADQSEKLLTAAREKAAAILAGDRSIGCPEGPCTVTFCGIAIRKVCAFRDGVEDDMLDFRPESS